MWDYDNRVKNILDYLEEVRWSILYSPENSIMAAIEQVEGKIINGLESKQIFNAS